MKLVRDIGGSDATTLGFWFWDECKRGLDYPEHEYVRCLILVKVADIVTHEAKVHVVHALHFDMRRTYENVVNSIFSGGVR